MFKDNCFGVNIFIWVRFCAPAAEFSELKTSISASEGKLKCSWETQKQMIYEHKLCSLISNCEQQIVNISSTLI